MNAPRALACAALWLAAACDGASNDPGLDAWLRVAGAQYEPSELPAPNGGPEVQSASTSRPTLRIGTRNERLSGTLSPHANAVAVRRTDDRGYWILTAGLPSVDAPELPTFSAALELSLRTPPGDFELQLSAVDRAGRFGSRETIALSASEQAIDAELIITLRWDNDADLDLHVIDPDGVELWAQNINTVEPPPPGQPPSDPDAWRAGGMLDFDSNAECVIDGRTEENAFWMQDPPSGAYLVRVATRSLCGEPAAHWSVEARSNGKSIGRAQGVSLTSDTRAPSGAGGGLDALAFELR